MVCTNKLSLLIRARIVKILNTECAYFPQQFISLCMQIDVLKGTFLSAHKLLEDYTATICLASSGFSFASQNGSPLECLQNIFACFGTALALVFEHVSCGSVVGLRGSDQWRWGLCRVAEVTDPSRGTGQWVFLWVPQI